MAKIRWISSVKDKYKDDLIALQSRLQQFYSTNRDYYKDIDFTHNNWTDPDQKIYAEILDVLDASERILEIGCGKANILAARPDIQSRYTGLEFSPEIIKKNQLKYPEASFYRIKDPLKYPIPDKSFDLIFSVFVLEHLVFPVSFLQEMSRILRTGGILIILCPDFLGSGRLTSQRSGLSYGMGSEKLKRKKVLDALLTGIDNKIHIPFYCWYLRNFKGKNKGFYININPTCFKDPFYPDSDAVYVTYEKEIKKFFGSSVKWENSGSSVHRQIKSEKLIFLKGKKV
jgi:SAM-dependent methyltransferase